MLLLGAAAAALALALAAVLPDGAACWVVNTVPVKIDSGGESRLVNTHHHPLHINSAEPGCEIIAVIFTPGEGAPFPQGNELYMVALTDPEHDVEIKGEGCVNHANGACTDEAYSFRVNYRHLHNNGDRALGYNWCIPKGWQSECDFQPLNDTCPNIEPATYNCPRCDAANACDTAKYGRYCQTWDPSFKVGTDAAGNDVRTGINPSGEQGDCLFSIEVALFNKRPKKCEVRPFRVHSFHPDQLAHQGDELQYTVVVEGDDADIQPNEKLEFWVRSFPSSCTQYKTWFDATPVAERTAVVQQCGNGADKFYHGLSTLFPDDGTDFNTALGVGQHCAGHSQPDKCSPKHFSDEMFPFGRCRIFGCAALPDAKQTDTDKCAYGDLLASTNFEFTFELAESAQSTCAANDPESFRFYEVLFHGAATTMGPLGTTGTLDNEPNFCCNIDGIHVENPNKELFTGAPSPPGSLQNIPCGVGPDGRAMVFDACNVCGGSGKSCSLDSQNSGSGQQSGAVAAATAPTSLVAAAFAAAALL